MTYINDNIEVTKTRLYQRSCDFRDFEGLTTEDIARIKEFAEAKRKQYKENYRSFDLINRGLYINTMEGLIQQSIYRRLKNFDEKIFFLINVVDPELKAYYTYVETELTPVREIKKLTEPKAIEAAKAKRTKQLILLESRIRQALGFYDRDLLKYEEIYRKKFIKETKFAEHVKMSMLPLLLDNCAYVQTFNSITPERYQELEQLAQKWLSSTKNIKDANSLAYSIVRQKNLLPTNNIFEQICLLILAIDPELNALRIHEEESLREKEMTKSMLELGFYHPNFPKVERIFHAKFMPYKVVSEWTI